MGGVPPPLPSSEPPPKISDPSLAVGSPPPVTQHGGKFSPAAHLFSVLLSLFLGLFLVEAVFSLADDSCVLFFNLRALSGMRGMLSFIAALAALLIYVLMGFTTAIPKRLFLPLALFNVVAGLLVIPCLIYFYDRIEQVACVLSYCQLILGLRILYKIQGGLKLHWPLVPEERLNPAQFSWRNLSAFLLANVFVLVPAIAVYLFVCATRAVDHFSDGFMALHPSGFTVQVRKYVRDDGKTIQLVPMAHVGEPEFYRQLSQSFPTNALILMEGVSDDHNLLTNKISYQRMATSLGLAEQHEEFKPSPNQMVRADVDVQQFATNTIDFINLAMLAHTQGVNEETFGKLMQYAPVPGFEQELFEDLLRKRNRHLLQEIHARLAHTQNIIVPWGAAHMPEIAKEIQKDGFRLNAAREYTAIRFHGGKKSGKARE